MNEFVPLERDPNYGVSRDGRVFSYRRNSVLTPQWDGRYFHVALCAHGRKTIALVHRLIAETFVDNPKGYPCVNHVDGNRRNNRASNLEWCTHSQNTRHAIRTGLLKRPLNTCGKPVARMDETRNVIETYPSLSEAARRMGVTPQSIASAIKRGYHTGGFSWAYENGGGGAE